VLEIRWGLTPDMTITATLPRLVGLDVAKELTWTGRMLSGTEAHALGLATRLSDDPLADALALAREIAAKSPQAIKGAKRLFDQSGRVPLAQQYADERTTIASVIGRPNQVEAVTAYFEKRDPVFHD
jgi:enoyl-CoA hydratase/carnithine racemase